MATLKKQFLDYAGLQQFWGIIDAKFANKVDAVKVESFGFTTAADSVTMTYTDSAANAKGYDIVMPMATDEKAGLMSADAHALLTDIDNKINEAAPFHGLKIAGNEVNLTGKRANIGLNFDTTGNVEDGSRQAFIELVDLNYPAGQSWTVVTAAEYETNYESNAAYYACEADGKFYKWSQDGVAGPVNNLGEPLMAQPISRIDVSELVKAGLLQDADVVYKAEEGENPAGMYLKLVFITSHGKDGATDETKEVFINVTDLVDIYTAGEGIEISNNDMSAGDNERTGTIKVRVATDSTLGAVKVGFTTDDAKQHYKVQLDANNNAYVAVPWEHTEVSFSTPKNADGTEKDVNSDGNPYLVVTNNSTVETDANGIKTNKFIYEVAVGEGLKNAESYAKTSVQEARVGAISETDAVAGANEIGITKDAYLKVQTVSNGDWGRSVKAELTDSAKASLGLADVAVQSVVPATTERGDDTHTPEGDDLKVEIVAADGSEYAAEKGEKTVKVSLGDKTLASLDKADTALQTVTILGTALNIDSPAYTREQADFALGLGSAAGVAYTTDVTLAEQAIEVDDKFATGGKESRPTVATTAAVKSYVDAQNEAQTEALQNFTTSAINALDTVDEPQAGEHAHIKNDSVEAAYDYTNGKYAGEEGFAGNSQTILTQVGQTDGILDTAKAKTAAIGIQDIYDFAPLSSADILAICNGTNE
jgi:hypothetical protein